MLEATEQLLEQRADLHAGEVRAEAEMPPEAEREMARGVVSADVEAERVGEDVSSRLAEAKDRYSSVAGLERDVAQGERLPGRCA